MVKVGQEKRARYWGRFTVKKVAKLAKPITCHSAEIGEALFEPCLVQIEWEKSPSEDKHEFWFPYWITVAEKERYGQYAPMIGESALLELLQEAIKQNFFSGDFLSRLLQAIEQRKEHGVT